MPSFQYVTLVASGGQPVRLADQIGAPYPTTGSGALVFANGATLSNVTIIGQVIPSPLGLTAGTVGAPSLYFATADRGLYSTGAGNISIASLASQVAAFNYQGTSLINFANNTQLIAYSDVAGEVAVEAQQTVGSTSYVLDFNKYGGNVVVGGGLSAHAPTDGNLYAYGHITVSELTALPAGGDAYAALYFGTSTMSVRAGTGAPTVSAGRGSIYLRNDVIAGLNGIPSYNTDDGTTWDQLVGRTSTQTLTNKTFTSPTLASPTITGTVAGGATYTAITLTGPTITGTVAGGGTYSSITLVTPVLGVATATSLAIGGAALGGNALAVTGTALFNGAVTNASTTTLSAALTYGGVTLLNSVTGTGSMVLSASPTLTGTPLAPTAAINTNTTQIATTAFVGTAVGAIKIVTQVFTAASGTYTPTANMLYCIVECWGGGGGGGGSANASATISAYAGGGGAGSYSRITLSAATIGVSKAYACGAAGASGAAGNNVGGNGGDTTLGSTLCVGKGGTGGPGNDGSGTRSQGGAGGVAGTGDITTVGEAGSGTAIIGTTQPIPLGGGGSSTVGGGGRGVAAAGGTGIAGTGHGSGGSGGNSINGGGTQAGGAGTTGYIVITEFCSH